MAEPRSVTVQVKVEVDGLDDEQTATVAALEISRRLINPSGLQNVSLEDLTALADYILTGEYGASDG